MTSRQRNGQHDIARPLRHLNTHNSKKGKLPVESVLGEVVLLLSIVLLNGAQGSLCCTC